MNSLKKVSSYQDANKWLERLRESLFGLPTIHGMLEHSDPLQLDISAGLGSLIAHGQKDIEESRLSLLSYIVAHCLKDAGQTDGVFRFRGHDCRWHLKLDLFSEEVRLRLALRSEDVEVANA